MKMLTQAVFTSVFGFDVWVGVPAKSEVFHPWHQVMPYGDGARSYTEPGPRRILGGHSGRRDPNGMLSAYQAWVEVARVRDTLSAVEALIASSENSPGLP